MTFKRAMLSIFGFVVLFGSLAPAEAQDRGDGYHHRHRHCFYRHHHRVCR